MVSKAKEHMVDETMGSILKAEEQNDKVINKIMHSNTKKSTKTVDPVLELGRLSSDIAVKLK
jgi:hypothetical protein